MIRFLIKYFNQQIDLKLAIIFGSVFCFNTAILGIIHHPYFHNILVIGMRTRVAICGLIYRKVKFLIYSLFYFNKYFLFLIKRH
jgi:hypothetical protein